MNEASEEDVEDNGPTCREQDEHYCRSAQLWARQRRLAMRAVRQQSCQTRRNHFGFRKWPQAARHICNNPSEIGNGSCCRQARQASGLVPRILAEAGQGGEDAERPAITLGSNVCLQEPVQVGVLQEKASEYGKTRSCCLWI